MRAQGSGIGDQSLPRIADLARLSTAELEASLAADCALRGACARALGRALSANPHKRQSADWRRWREGWRGFVEDVSREAMKRPKLGRGRSKLGVRREWTAADDAVLLLYHGQENSARIGRRLGKTGQAVRNRLHRIRREGER